MRNKRLIGIKSRRTYGGNLSKTFKVADKPTDKPTEQIIMIQIIYALTHIERSTYTSNQKSMGVKGMGTLGE